MSLHQVVRIDKPWGWEETLDKTDDYMLKRLFMWGGKRCSLQYHEFKTETVLVVSGLLEILVENNMRTYGAGDFVTIQPNQSHRMRAVEDCLYIECSTPFPKDVVRLEDDYGRL